MGATIPTPAKNEHPTSFDLYSDLYSATDCFLCLFTQERKPDKTQSAAVE